jgi:hypothetical protein
MEQNPLENQVTVLTKNFLVVSKRRARSEIFNQKVETPEISPKIQ